MRFSHFGIYVTDGLDRVQRTLTPQESSRSWAAARDEEKKTGAPLSKEPTPPQVWLWSSQPQAHLQVGPDGGVQLADGSFVSVGSQGHNQVQDRQSAQGRRPRRGLARAGEGHRLTLSLHPRGERQVGEVRMRTRRLKEPMNDNHGLHLMEYSPGTRHYRRCLTSVNPSNSHSNPAAGTISFSIVDQAKGKEWVTCPSHTARKWWSWDLNPDGEFPGSLSFPSGQYCRSRKESLNPCSGAETFDISSLS